MNILWEKMERKEAGLSELERYRGRMCVVMGLGVRGKEREKVVYIEALVKLGLLGREGQEVNRGISGG